MKTKNKGFDFIKQTITFASVALLVTACGGGSEGGEAETSNSTATFLVTGYDVAKLEKSESLDISVEVVDDLGAVIDTSFTVTSNETCADVTTHAGAITVTSYANKVPCKEDITIVAGEHTKNITLNVYDPDSMDIGGGLLIRYVNEYEPIWTMANSHRVRFWKPIVKDGYHALGSLARGSAAHADVDADLAVTKNVPMIVVKDISEAQDLLQAPDHYEQIWYHRMLDLFTGNWTFRAVFRPVCNPGYGSLGTVATYSPQITVAQPAPNAAICVKNEYLIKGSAKEDANPGKLLYTDADSGDSGFPYGNVELRLAGPTTIKDLKTAPLWPGTVVACEVSAGSPACGTVNEYNFLAIPLTVIETIDKRNKRPRLTSPHNYEITGPRFHSSMRLPFTLIPSQDRDCADADVCTEAADQVANNVTYNSFHYIGREEVYVHQDKLSLDNYTGSLERETDTLTQQVTDIKTQIETMTKTTSMKVSASGGLSLGSLSLGASVDITNTLAVESTLENSNALETGITINPYPVPAKTFFEVLTIDNRFFTARETQTGVTHLISDWYSGDRMILEYSQ